MRSEPPPGLRRAYRATRYEVDGVGFRIGRRSPAADRLLVGMGVREAGFATAWNPLSRRMPEGWNRRMQRRLAARARRHPLRAGTGRFRGWSEEHLLIGAPEAAVLRLARLFRQRAVVMLRRGRPPRLAWVRR